MIAAPRTRYAKSGDVDIAYQVFGDGPLDLLMFAGAGVPIDCVDDEPGMARFQRRLGSLCRVIRFDVRGMGLSDHVPPSTLSNDLWVQDALAVLDAVGSPRAAIFAPATAGTQGILLAATHPDRVHSLVLVNAAARAVGTGLPGRRGQRCPRDLPQRRRGVRRAGAGLRRVGAHRPDCRRRRGVPVVVRPRG